jgi:hypothetical protein
MLAETEILPIFFNYGIAGLILFVFYKLFSNELVLLRQTISEMNSNIIVLTKKLDRLNKLVDDS